MKQMETKEQQYKELLESILSHIESGLISLEFSSYLLEDIKKALE
jgi:exonuclease VII small subunit